MKRLFPYLIIVALAILPVSSCKKSARDVYAETVEEWIGKEILFPDSMMTVTGEMISPPTADFTIVSYYDSTGCTGCRMKLPFWNEFMNKVDSLKSGYSVSLVIIASMQDKKELSYLVHRDTFKYQIVTDVDGKLYELNHFPIDKQCNTFLTGRDNRVLLIGNPLINRKIREKYLKIIGDGSTEEPSGKYISTYKHAFGEITAGESVTHIFSLKNETYDTLKVSKIISSCDCTVGIVSPKVIPSGSIYTVTITFKDTITGDFYRTLNLLFENNNNEIQFEISGKISDK